MEIKNITKKIKTQAKNLGLVAIIAGLTACGGSGGGSSNSTPTTNTTNLTKSQTQQTIEDYGATLQTNSSTPTFWDITTNNKVNTPTATINYSQLDNSKCDTFSGGNLGQFSVLNCDGDAGLYTTGATPTNYVINGDVSNLESLGNDDKIAGVVSENMTQAQLTALLGNIQGGNSKVQGEPLHYFLNPSGTASGDIDYQKYFGVNPFNSANAEFFLGVNSSAPINANLVDFSNTAQDTEAITYNSASNTISITNPNNTTIPNGLFTIVNPDTNEVMGLVRNQVESGGQICPKGTFFYSPSIDSCSSN